MPFIVGVLSFVRPPLRSISSTIGLPSESTPLPTLSVIESIVVPVGALVSISILDLSGLLTLPASSFATTDISCLPSDSGLSGVNVHLPSLPTSTS